MAGTGKIRAIGAATRFKPGQSGNPGGRPRGLSITALVRAELQKPSADGSGGTNAEALARRVVDLAIGGHPAFVKLVWSYVDGEPKQAAELNLRELCDQLAEQMGIDAERLWSAFSQEVGA